jgi:hypothetical protein
MTQALYAHMNNKTIKKSLLLLVSTDAYLDPGIDQRQESDDRDNFFPQRNGRNKSIVGKM